MRKLFFDEDLQSDFIQKGYIKTPLLSDEEINYVLHELGKLTPNDNFDPDGSAVYRNTFHTTFLDTNIEYKRKTFDIISKLVSPYLEKLLVNYKILICQFVIKPPGKGDLLPHQNWHFTPDITDTALTIWCPLVEVNESNGTIQVVAGSHKLSPYIASPSLPNYCVNFEDEVRERHSTPISLNAGEALIFDDSLLHWSHTNESDSPRYVLVAECIPLDQPAVIYYLDHSIPEKGFELLEISSDFFIENTPLVLAQRPASFKSLGFVENKNQILTEEEFVGLLNERKGTAKKGFDSTVNKKSTNDFLGKFRLLRKFRFLKRFIAKE